VDEVEPTGGVPSTPPARFGPPPPYTPAAGIPPSPPSPKPRRMRRSPWLIAAAALVAFALVGAGAWFGPRIAANLRVSRSTTPQTTTSAAATTAPTTPTSRPTFTADDLRLRGSLLFKLDQSACTPVHPPTGRSLSTLDCTVPDRENGSPTAVRYRLEPDSGAVQQDFDDLAAELRFTLCPFATLERPHWSSTFYPPGGWRTCGTRGDTPTEIWTRDDAPIVGEAWGPNLHDVDDWFKYTFYK
jgi:hypothetical protein